MKDTSNKSAKNFWGAMFLFVGLVIILLGLMRTKSSIKNISDIQDVLKGSNRGGKLVYFDIKAEPKLVGEEGGKSFYLLRGEKYFHIAMLTKGEFNKISADVKKHGKTRVTGKTQYLKDTGAEAEIAESCEDMYKVGVIRDNLYMFVGDVYIDYMKADYVTILTSMYLGRIICGVILIAIGVCICAIGPHKRVKKVKKPQPAVQTRKSFVYKGKWAYDAATREYRRLYGKSENEELTDEENNKIYDYTMMPLSYFFGWLCERDLIGEGFAEEFGEDKAKEIIESIKTHRRTPLEVLADLDYYFTEDWLKKEAKYFLWLYFEARDNYYTDDDVYLYDYYECNGDPDNRFFCMEYSFDVQQKINRLIDDRYADNNNSPNYSDGEYYSDDEDEDAPVVTIHSTLFDKDLEVERAGRIIKGVFPDDYARKCVKCLDNMSQKEWHRLERWIMDNYGVEASEAKIDKFGAYSISIYEPEYDGDLAFIINGGADYEEEHGVSITIRNGILLDWGYYMESREPYDEELVKRYEMYTGEIDFENLTNQSELESFVSQGKLIRTQMLPKSLGGEDSSDNMVVVTPEAYEHMQRIIKRLKTIQTYANSTYINGELRVVAKAEYQVNAKGTKLLVPMSVSYNTPNTPNKKSLRIFMWTKVWE